MVTSIIGRRFLNHYNQQRGTELSAKEFFEQIYLPLFYDHPKYMMDGGNTALSNPKIPKGTFSTSEQRQVRFVKLIKNIEAGYLDTRTALDFQASSEKEFATTSGQVTDLTLASDEDSVYCSWIGGGFGIGVAGGQLILFDQLDILDVLFDGWHIYRSDLNDPAYDDLAGNQINTWNGQWLAHRFGSNYRLQDPRQNFSPYERAADKSLRVASQTWLSILLGITRKIFIPRLTGYIYKLGQTNSTYGFISFELPEIRRPSEFYVKLFGEYAYQRDTAKIEALYSSARSFQSACQRGAIGVAALEPKGLRDLIPSSRGEAKNFKYESSTEDNQLTFNTYITWLLAMLNNDEFWDEAGQAATLFLQYEQGAGKLKADRGNQIDKLRNASGKRQFLEALVTVMENSNVELLRELEAFAKKIHKLPNDNFPYFQTLIRLRYAKQSRETTPDLSSTH